VLRGTAGIKPMGKLLQLSKSPSERANLIDEFGDVCRRRADFAPIEKRHGQLAAEIKTWYEEEDPEKVFVEKGARYQLDVSVRANVTAINNRAVYRILGIAKFLEACSLTLTALRKYMTTPEVDAVSSQERTGSRSYTAVPILGSPAAVSGSEPKAAA
jgi:hypothetical protein